MNDNNLVWQHYSVSRADRERLHGHKSAAIWLTGLSGSGKSSIANELAQQLQQKNYSVFVLDGDNVRHGLNRDLGFAAADRSENIRRVAEVAKLFVEAGVIVICAFIAPFAADRAKARALFAADDYVEIFCDCPLDVCQQRESKGLYQKAHAGQVPQFTGVSSPYQAPQQPDLVLNTARDSLADNVQIALDHLHQRQIFALAE